MENQHILLFFQINEWSSSIHQGGCDNPHLVTQRSTSTLGAAQAPSGTGVSTGAVGSTSASACDRVAAMGSDGEILQKDESTIIPYPLNIAV